ncbi:hypothetical protein SGM_3702 [Streptomyces griseoaurantiacus M045]|uniref:Uncharacterized protein n=1 Tax=Streptomyces griseoaurantiacus M045 TaxID=996637 RepID=F3NKN8_9ACTN|nr:hypothetical protein SGM_3702 [Streptomyces griseoaurantiacus M045]
MPTAPRTAAVPPAFRAVAVPSVSRAVAVPSVSRAVAVPVGVPDGDQYVTRRDRIVFSRQVYRRLVRARPGPRPSEGPANSPVLRDSWRKSPGQEV